MPDILLVHFDRLEIDLLKELIEQAGFRVKATSSVHTAKEWAKLSDFFAVFASSTLTSREQHDLADLLWHGNPEAAFIVFDLDPEHVYEPGEARLLGAEIAVGPNAMADLKTLVSTLSARRKIQSADFRILLVDDLDSPRYIISLLLEELGYSLVTGLESAKKALAELKADPKKYSCVVTDIRMPEMTGKQLIEAIRSDSKLEHLPIIVLTAYGTSDALIDCLKVGASGFLVKPPKKADLARELARARRIAARMKNPRLAEPEEVESIRQVLEGRGLI